MLIESVLQMGCFLILFLPYIIFSILTLLKVTFSLVIIFVLILCFIEYQFLEYLQSYGKK